VQTLSELLALRVHDIPLDSAGHSMGTVDKLHEENMALRSFIASINVPHTHPTVIINSLADIFRCEQDRRRAQVHSSDLEEEIQHMCDYQREALAKLVSQDRLVLIDELEQTKHELEVLKKQFEVLKINQHHSIGLQTSHLNKFYARYLRSEAYRKALIYQKRYLLVLLAGYRDTELFALHELRRLTGDAIPSLAKNNGISIRSIRRTSIHPRFRFRSFVRVVIGTIRLRWLAAKWARKMAHLR
jgi:hypothetical protein